MRECIVDQTHADAENLHVQSWHFLASAMIQTVEYKTLRTSFHVQVLMQISISISTCLQQGSFSALIN